MKSYTGNAVLAFILYWLLWLPGLIVNYMFYREAKRTEKIAGQSLPGVGCLSVMLIINVAVSVFLISLVVFLAVLGGLGSN
jgi:hypothetical protein